MSRPEYEGFAVLLGAALVFVLGWISGFATGLLW